MASSKRSVLRPPRAAAIDSGQVTGKPGSDPQAVIAAIRRIAQAIRIASRRNERQRGASTAQMLVLSTLAGAREPIALKLLALRTNTHQSSASVVVSKLVDRGLVRRLRAAHDARLQQLSLTGEGRKIVASAPVDAASEQLLAALSGMARRDVADLSRLLHELVEKLETVQRERAAN